jgi:hypothetical protein
LLIYLSLSSRLYIKNPCQFFTRHNFIPGRLNEQNILHSEQETPGQNKNRPGTSLKTEGPDHGIIMVIEPSIITKITTPS